MTIYDVIKEVKPKITIERESNFIEEGIFDSLDIMSMVEKLEEYFGCIIKGSDITPENFETIESIERLILKSGGKIHE